MKSGFAVERVTTSRTTAGAQLSPLFGLARTSEAIGSCPLVILQPLRNSLKRR